MFVHALLESIVQVQEKIKCTGIPVFLSALMASFRLRDNTVVLLANGLRGFDVRDLRLYQTTQGLQNLMRVNFGKHIGLRWVVTLGRSYNLFIITHHSHTRQITENES